MAAVVEPVINVGTDLVLAQLGVVVVQNGGVNGNVLFLPHFGHDELATGP